MNGKLLALLLAMLLSGCTNNTMNPGNNVVLPDMHASASDMSNPLPTGKPWTVGLVASNWAQASRVAAGTDGSALVTGSFLGSLTLGGTTYVSTGASMADAFFAKYSADGNQIVSGHIGDSDGVSGMDIAEDTSKSIYLAGAHYGTVNIGTSTLKSAGDSDILLVKYGPDGTPAWAKGMGGTDADYATRLVVGPDYLILIGSFKNIVNFGGGPLISAGQEDIFVAKFSLNGTHQWSQRFGGSERDIPLGAVLDSQGNIVVTGYFNDAIKFGTEQWTSKGKEDIFVVKLSPAGTYLWGEQIGSSDTDAGYGLALDGSDNIVLTGQILGAVTIGGKTINPVMLVQKLTPAGGNLWARGTTSGAAYVYEGAVDSSGIITVVGMYVGKADVGGGPLPMDPSGQGSIFAASFSADGAYHGALTIAGSAFSYAHGIAAVAPGAMVLMGLFEGTIDVNGMHFAGSGPGRRNSFLTRMALP